MLTHIGYHGSATCPARIFFCVTPWPSGLLGPETETAVTGAQHIRERIRWSDFTSLATAEIYEGKGSLDMNEQNSLRADVYGV